MCTGKRRADRTERAKMGSPARHSAAARVAAEVGGGRLRWCSDSVESHWATGCCRDAAARDYRS